MQLRRISVRLTSAVALALSAAGAEAQAVGGLGDDATVLRFGTTRLSVANAWARYDRRYDPFGALEPLGADFTRPAIGPAELESLGPVQSAFRTFTGDAGIAVSLARTQTTLNALVRRTDLRADLGLTSWLMLTATVPIVFTKVEGSYNFNPGAEGGNFGLNPGRAAGAARDTNTLLLGQFQTAFNQLASLIAACRADPSGPRCDAVLANGEALNSSAQQFSAAVVQLYTDAGARFVPVGGSNVDNLVRTRVATLRSRYTDLGIGAITLPGPAAARVFGLGDAQRLFTESAFGIGADSIRTITERLGVGDVEFGATLLFLNTLPRAERYAPRGVALRSAVTGLARLGTGRPDRPQNLFDIGAGDGQLDVEVRSQNDLVFGRRLWITLVGRYGWQRPDDQELRVAPPDHPITAFYRQQLVQRDLGDYAELEVTPRLGLGDHFALSAAYLYRYKGTDQHTGTFTATNLAGDAVTLDARELDAETEMREHRVTLGVGYSTLAAYARRRTRFPVEVSWLYSRSVRGSGGRTPRIARHLVQLRLYTRLLGPDWREPAGRAR